MPFQIDINNDFTILVVIIDNDITNCSTPTAEVTSTKLGTEPVNIADSNHSLSPPHQPDDESSRGSSSSSAESTRSSIENMKNGGSGINKLEGNKLANDSGYRSLTEATSPPLVLTSNLALLNRKAKDFGPLFWMNVFWKKFYCMTQHRISLVPFHANFFSHCASKYCHTLCYPTIYICFFPLSVRKCPFSKRAITVLWFQRDWQTFTGKKFVISQRPAALYSFPLIVQFAHHIAYQSVYHLSYWYVSDIFPYYKHLFNFSFSHCCLRSFNFSLAYYLFTKLSWSWQYFPSCLFIDIYNFLSLFYQ